MLSPKYEAMLGASATQASEATALTVLAVCLVALAMVARWHPEEEQR